MLLSLPVGRTSFFQLYCGSNSEDQCHRDVDSSTKLSSWDTSEVLAEGSLNDPPLTRVTLEQRSLPSTDERREDWFVLLGVATQPSAMDASFTLIFLLQHR